MEVITEFTPILFLIFIGFGIISAGIIIALVFRKIKDYKQYQSSKNHSLNTDIDKIENTFNRTLRHLDELENFMIQSPIEVWKMELEITAIRGHIQHQLGHMSRIREWLK